MTLYQLWIDTCVFICELEENALRIYILKIRLQFIQPEQTVLTAAKSMSVKSGQYDHKCVFAVRYCTTIGILRLI